MAVDSSFVVSLESLEDSHVFGGRSASRAWRPVLWSDVTPPP